MKKKNILIIAIIVLLIILLFPIQINKLKDGGTVEYKAITYKISKIQKHSETYHEDGIVVEILGKEIFNNIIVKHIEREEQKIERTKLNDLKIVNSKNIDTTKLVKFDDVLYGKSNALIDYAGNLNKTIGKINFLISEEYMPELSGETNCKELFNSSCTRG